MWAWLPSLLVRRDFPVGEGISLWGCGFSEGRGLLLWVGLPMSLARSGLSVPKNPEPMDQMPGGSHKSSCIQKETACATSSLALNARLGLQEFPVGLDPRAFHEFLQGSPSKVRQRLTHGTHVDTHGNTIDVMGTTRAPQRGSGGHRICEVQARDMSRAADTRSQALGNLSPFLPH